MKSILKTAALLVLALGSFPVLAAGDETKNKVELDYLNGDLPKNFDVFQSENSIVIRRKSEELYLPQISIDKSGQWTKTILNLPKDNFWLSIRFPDKTKKFSFPILMIVEKNKLTFYERATYYDKDGKAIINGGDFCHSVNFTPVLDEDGGAFGSVEESMSGIHSVPIKNIANAYWITSDLSIECFKQKPAQLTHK